MSNPTEPGTSPARRNASSVIGVYADNPEAEVGPKALAFAETVYGPDAQLVIDSIGTPAPSGRPEFGRTHTVAVVLCTNHRDPRVRAYLNRHRKAAADA